MCYYRRTSPACEHLGWIVAIPCSKAAEGSPCWEWELLANAKPIPCHDCHLEYDFDHQPLPEYVDNMLLSGNISNLPQTMLLPGLATTNRSLSQSLSPETNDEAGKSLCTSGEQIQHDHLNMALTRNRRDAVDLSVVIPNPNSAESSSFAGIQPLWLFNREESVQTPYYTDWPDDTACSLSCALYPSIPFAELSTPPQSLVPISPKDQSVHPSDTCGDTV